MASFYNTACRVDAKLAFFVPEVKGSVIDEGLPFYVASNDGLTLELPQSIMNDNVAINYRTIYNGYPEYYDKNNPNTFTDYDDYKRCIAAVDDYALFLQNKQNPTYKNILKYYSDKQFDPYGLATYRMQDFIYLKYYNQIPNNYMITLRRYTYPCNDHMFGLDLSPSDVNALNGYEESHFNIATAVTYMGEKAGNKLSDILKFDYGANYEEKEAKVEMLQNTDGGLAEQMTKKFGVNDQFLSGEMSRESAGGMGGLAKQAAKFAMLTGMKGVSVSEAMAASHRFQGNEFAQVYGENVYGDVNVINKTKVRSRGLTYGGNFSLNFEYSLKSLKCVNPRVAMLDILTNFLILTGNYGAFWGGETRFYGQKSIAPQFGDPAKLRNGDFKGYFSSLMGDLKSGFKEISKNSDGTDGGIMGFIKNLGAGTLEGLLGNLFGGNVGVAGQTQATPALLSGNPTGYWHVTIGNPLDPIAMMGNLAVTKTTVQFNDVLGYDDFPTEVKFTVELEHCMPRDNAAIENMFNGAKGRIYTFTDGGLLNAFVDVDNSGTWQQRNTDQQSQQTNINFDSNSRVISMNKLKVIGANIGK